MKMCNSRMKICNSNRCSETESPIDTVRTRKRLPCGSKAGVLVNLELGGLLIKLDLQL